MRSLSILVLALASTCVLSAQSAPFKGSFGFLLSAQLRPASTDSGTAILGVMNFDGAGNLSGTYTTQLSASDTQAAQTLTGSFTGTYSTNSDGTGSVTLNLDLGFSQTFAVVITSGGKGLQLVTTQCGCDLGGIVISGTAHAASPGPVKGAYGFELVNSPVPSGTLGVMQFDGAGNASVSFTSVGIASDVSGSNPGQPPVMKGTLSGTYSVNPDGSGTADFTASSGGVFTFVVTDGGSGLQLLLTNGTGSNVSFGTAQLQ